METVIADSRIRQRILELLERGSRVLGLRMCMHEHAVRLGLPLCWRQHENPACLAVKATRQSQCAAFCGVQVPKLLQDRPEGSIHDCPFGHTDLAVALRVDGMLAGVLYAGVAWTGKGEPPRSGFVVHPGRAWLEDRRLALAALAREAEHRLQERRNARPPRREQILSYLERNLHRPLRLEDLAEELHLSASRTGHVLAELFEESFPRLLSRLRLAQAEHRLRFTDDPVGLIAADLGFADQSHFTRSFREQYGLPPLRWRRERRSPV